MSKSKVVKYMRNVKSNIISSQSGGEITFTREQIRAAQEAVLAAQEAKAAAQEAKAAAQEAKDTAQEAKDTAQEAKAAAQKAKDTAQEAKDTAQKAVLAANPINEYFIDYFNSEMYTAYEMIIDVNENFDGSPVHPQINYVLLPYFVIEDNTQEGGRSKRRSSQTSQKGGTFGNLRLMFCCFNVNHAKYDDEVTWVYNPDFVKDTIDEKQQNEMYEAFAKFHQLIEKINKVEEVLNKKAEMINDKLQGLQGLQGIDIYIAHNVENHIKNFCNNRLKEILMLNVGEVVPEVENDKSTIKMEMQMDILHFEAYFVYVGALMQEIARHMTRYKVKNGLLELTISFQQAEIKYNICKHPDRYIASIMIPSGSELYEIVSFPCLMDKLNGKYISSLYESVTSFTVELNMEGIKKAMVTKEISKQLKYENYIGNIKKWFKYSDDLQLYKEEDKQVGTFQYKNIYYRNDMLLQTTEIIPEVDANAVTTSETIPEVDANAVTTSETIPEVDANAVTTSETIPEVDANTLKTETDPYFIGDVVSRLMMYTV
jgi:hypothetical protein